MRKKYAQAALLLAATVVFLLPAFSTVHSQADMEIVSNEQFENPARPSAVFPHDAHNAAAELEDRCWFCHHMDGTNPNEDESSEGVPCSDCHMEDAEKGATDLMHAYHSQCIHCHEDRGAGPLACGECHVK